MNFVFRGFRLGPAGCSGAKVYVLAGLFACLFLGSGCSDGVRALSSEEIREFNRIGAGGPSLDLEGLVRARYAAGPYRVVPDDVLELTMPSILQVVTMESVASEDENRSLMCRVRDDGTISLPVVGSLFVAGHSLSEIEKAVVDAYYPTYTQTHPAVFAQVAQFKTYKVSVNGAVGRPGIYELRGDQMSLVALINQAEGIIPAGASSIRIERNSLAGTASAPVRLHPAAERKGSGRPRRKSVSLAAFVPAQDIPRDDGIQLSFQPQERGSTLGRLSITKQGRIIVQERIDLRSEAQRYVMLSRAAQIDPTVSIIDLNVKLASLASLLCGYVAHNRPMSLVSAETEEAGKVCSPDMVLEDIRKIEQYRTGLEPSPEHAQDTIVLPVKGKNIPFADIALHEGDNVVVKQLPTPLFAVIGLVATPGNYEYPPDAQYNLVQAIAFAGGLDPRSEPRYVTVYRLKADGSIARIVFQLKEDSRLTDQLNIPIRPGDVVSVEHTPRTRKNQFLREIIRINVGTYFRVEELWNDEQ